METRRLILFAALAFILYTLWTNWQADYPSPSARVDQTQADKRNDESLLPDEKTFGEQHITEKKERAERSFISKQQSGSLIHVKTDVLDIEIDTKHGAIVKASLLKYPVSVEEQDTPFVLLSDTPLHRYIAKSSLISKQNSGVEDVNFNYSSPKKYYQIANEQNLLEVSLRGTSKDGIEVTKTFSFNRGDYLINTRYDLINQGNTAWKGYMNNQILRMSPGDDKSSLFHIGTFTGASYSNPPHHRYKKISFSNMAKSNLNEDVKGGWIAMQQHYFLSAWIPNPKTKNVFYTRTADDTYTIGSVSQPIVLQPQQSQVIDANLYLGPEIASVLKSISPGLDLTVDYGWLWFLSSLLFKFMTFIHHFVGNWGWSIVLVTVLIKLAFYRLSAKSYRSMAGMRKLQPKLQALRERFGEDKAKLSQATMELYRQEKVNPLGGCLPILVQIPVFIALYWVLIESVELRQAPFIFWIKDLAEADPYHILPIIMGGTMLIQQRLNPAPPDPTQAKIMMFLPVLFTGLFWNFPSGLVLYWIVNNTLSILQQWYITRKYGDGVPDSKVVSSNK